MDTHIIDEDGYLIGGLYETAEELPLPNYWDDYEYTKPLRRDYYDNSTPFDDN